MTHVSLKSMAEGKVEGVGKATYFKVDPRIVEVEEGFNGRPINREHVEALKISFKSGAVVPPIFVRIEDGRIILVDGHHRITALLELIAEGVEIIGVEAIQFRGSEADRVAHMLTSAQGLPMTPLQMGRQYKKLLGYGWDAKLIADKVGKTKFYVTEMIALAESNVDVQSLVDSKKVSASTAVKLVRKHGSKAGSVIAKHLSDAQAAGGTKVTPKMVKPAAALTLQQAIRDEMCGGARVELVLPEFADLIEYLRGSGAATATE